MTMFEKKWCFLSWKTNVKHRIRPNYRWKELKLKSSPNHHFWHFWRFLPLPADSFLGSVCQQWDDIVSFPSRFPVSFLVTCCIYGIVLPSYIGTIICHKDPFLKLSFHVRCLKGVCLMLLYTSLRGESQGELIVTSSLENSEPRLA